MWISGTCCSKKINSVLYCVQVESLCMVSFSDSGEACSGRKYRFRIFVFLLQICHCVSCVSHRGKTNILPCLPIQLIYILSFFIYDTCSKHYYCSYLGFIIIRTYLTHTTYTCIIDMNDMQIVWLFEERCAINCGRSD